LSNRNQDLEKSCVLFLSDMLHLRRDNKMLLYTDEASNDVIVEALLFEAKKLGVQTDIIRLHTFPGLSEQEKALVEKIANGKYDAVCELSGQYFYPSAVWKKALQKGCRVYSLGAIDSDSFIRCIGKTDHVKLYNFGLLLYRLLCRSRTVQIYTESGTNITCKMTSQRLMVKILTRLKLMQRSKVFRPDGMLKTRSSATFMAGQVAFQGIPDTIEGKVVIDGYLWPPDEIGQIVDPIVLRIRKGCVTNIEGCPSKSLILSNWLEGKEKTVMHFCIGFHPGAQLSGQLVEAERTFGNIVIGIGKYPFHADGIIKNPTLKLNDAVILQNGTFVHDKLSVLAQELFRPFLGNEFVNSNSKS
jgi:2,5-dihydroxypyridine 5,6-dioxygenase